ncbi:MAG: DUF2231 domain-containing protein [Myxococcota bacterium]
MDLHLHPMVVHFPIALAILWPLVDLCGLLLKRPDVSRVGLALLGLGAVSALVATVTGQSDYDAAIARGFKPELLDAHADPGGLVPWMLLGTLAIRVLLPRRAGNKAQVLAIILGTIVAGWVAVVGYQGGRLSFGAGVGIDRPGTSS